MANVVKKNQTADIPTKTGNKYSYQYVDIAQIHEYLEENNMSYYQYIEQIDGSDYIMTVKIIDGQEQPPLRGARIVDATLYGNDNPAQKQGSAITYARRYSLLMAFGLATEDDDAISLNDLSDSSDEEKEPTKEDAEKYVINFGKYRGKKLIDIVQKDEWYKNYLLGTDNNEYLKKCINLLDESDASKEHDSRMKLMNEITSLEFETDTAHEDMLAHFKVNSITELSIKQLSECKEILEKKLYKQIKTDEIKK